MNLLVRYILVIAMMLATSASADAGLLKSLLKGARNVAGKVMGEGSEAVARRASKVAVKQVDDVARIAMRSSDDVAKIAARNGDDVVKVVAKSADDVAAAGTKGGSKLLKPGGTLDQAADLVGRNKTSIATAAVATAVITNPEATFGAVADTAVGLTESIGSNVAKPLIQSSVEHVIGPTVSNALTFLLWGGAAAMIVLVVLRGNKLIADMKMLANLRHQLGRRVQRVDDSAIRSE